MRKMHHSYFHNLIEHSTIDNSISNTSITPFYNPRLFKFIDYNIFNDIYNDIDFNELF